MRGRRVTMPVPRGKLFPDCQLRPKWLLAMAVDPAQYVQVPPHNVLKHRTLSTRLGTNDCYLWEIYWILYLEVVEVSINAKLGSLD